MAFDNAYEAISESNGESRWAFGTGFEDPLAGIDTTVPPTADGDDLAVYCLGLGDDALILSHRLQEWCTRAPELEEEAALANIGLDLLGQARLLLARAGAADGSGRGEDYYAYFRDAGEFRNVRLAEIADGGDFGCAMARLLLFSTWRLALMSRLRDSIDPVLAALGGKAVPELTYHRDYAAAWVVRLGDGTDVSARRMREGLAAVRPYYGELFACGEQERRLSRVGVAVDPHVLRDEVDGVLATVLRTATLAEPDGESPVQVAGRAGHHGPELAAILAETQSVARRYPEATW